MIRLSLFLLASVLPPAHSGTSAKVVSIETLLPQMADLSRLARRPNPSYTQAQASSYDRASREPGNEAWFANGDAGKFFGEDKKEGRIERIMADLNGPGAVDRIWSANPVGILRFYFDGEVEARFAWNMPDLLSGKIRPMTDPFAYVASNGWDLYFPIPYAKSLKITIDDSKGDGVRGLYYHVNYRTYPPTTVVKSLTAEQLVSSSKLIEDTASKINSLPSLVRTGPEVIKKEFGPVGYQETILESNRKDSALTYLSIKFKYHDPVPVLEDLPWDHPLQFHNALRGIRLVADFDGERCIDVPVSDFFSSAAGPVPFSTIPITVLKDGTMISRFVMPFSKSTKLTLISAGGPRLDLDVRACIEPFKFDSESYLFHAQWMQANLFSRPMRDMEFLKARGEGFYVGSSLHVGNPTGAWWGEGDEKVFVDGEKFPSTFGTGSEDYFGYAWSSPNLFVRPYHAQPRCDGPGTRGHIQNLRWHIFDAIPYRNDLAFYLELWHWAEVTVDYDRTAYWYARPGGTTPRPIEDPKSLRLTVYPGAVPVKGAVEGESARILGVSGGHTEVQEFGDLSNSKQLWWLDMAQGDRLKLAIPVKEDGTYEVSGKFCMAPDYGMHRLTLDGKVLSESLDFYSKNLEWKVFSLGKVQLKAGQRELFVECQGHNPQAVPRNMFGLDYILLNKIG